MDEDGGSRRDTPSRRAKTQTEVTPERGPGVHVVTAVYPARAARTLAAAIGADLAETAAAAAVAIRARLGGRQDPSGGGAGDDGEAAAGALSTAEAEILLGLRLETHRIEAPTRTLAAAHVARLRQLAAAAERAERVREHTRRSLAETLAALPEAGVVASADSLRRASTAVLNARRAVAQFEAADQAAAQPGTQIQPVHREPPDPPTRPSLDSALVAGGVMLLGVALGGAILLTSLPTVIAIGPILLALVIAALVRRTTTVVTGWSDTRGLFDIPPGSSRPAVLIDAPTAGATLSTAGAGRDQARGDPGITALDSARARLAETEQRWTRLAGASADPNDITTIIDTNRTLGARRADIVAETAVVRAATRARERARAEWEEAWADLSPGVQPPPTAGDALETALNAVQQRIEDGDSPTPEPADSGGARDEKSPGGEARQVAAIRRLNRLLAKRSLELALGEERHRMRRGPAPLVLVEPFAGLDPTQQAVMRQQLDALAAEHEVIVIVRSGTVSPLSTGQ